MIAWAFILACTSPPPLTEVTLTPSVVVPTTVQLSWTTEQSGRSWAEYGIVDDIGAGDLDRRTPTSLVAGTVHAAHLVGLPAAASVRWRVVTELTDGTQLVSEEQTHTVADVPAGFPELQLEVSEPTAQLQRGYVVTSLIENDGGWAVILDARGRVVWWYDTGHAGQPPPDLQIPGSVAWSGSSLPLNNRLDRTTGSVVMSLYDRQQAVDVATVRRIPLTAMSADDVVTTRMPSGHHDFVLHSDTSTVTWLAYQPARIDGRDWAADAVLQTTEGSQQGTVEQVVWTWLDDFDAEPELTTPDQDRFSYDLADFEWTHSNSLMWLPDVGAYFLMSKFLDCVVRIDADTGRHAWVMGGPFSDFTGPDGAPVWEDLDDSALWSQAHMSHLWLDPSTGRGGLAVFDNGKYRDPDGVGAPSRSRAVAYAFDESTRTVTEVWSATPGSGGFTNLLGDVRRLDASYLVSWSTLPEGIEEIGEDGTVLWRVAPTEDPVNDGLILGRVVWTEELPLP
ncbi:MAG: aryl-sulfate sulfotransferase [Myxococcales bacterium]|nr:aryl-sulfate sulfotransferase [Myxococcales bacterium]